MAAHCITSKVYIIFSQTLNTGVLKGKYDLIFITSLLGSHLQTKAYQKKGVEVAKKFSRFESNLLAVLAKERELRKVGYQENTLQDEYQLKCGEYFVRVPYPENTENLQGWENVTLFWCSS